MRRSLLTATALLALAGLAACDAGNLGGDDPAEENTTVAEAAPGSTAEEEAPAEEPTGIDPRLEAIVGTWEADYDDVGPHGSTLTIEEDGTAVLSSFANQHGDYEGTVNMNDGDPNVFVGTEPETEEEITVQLVYDAEADTLTLEYPGDGGIIAHTRAEEG
ncbi:hypothetical protein [Glycomyces sp. NPDC048151]|uniref:hypothetical protein n=1 Tax=Glycomyces sp. NPDC048151 TaxID=3364002 RepID=UPI00371DBA4B